MVLMTVEVLVADDDLDVHELVNDILSITFKDIKVDRVLDAESFRAKANSHKNQYDLVLIASDVADASGKDIISILLDEFPTLIEKTAIIEETAATVRFDRSGAEIPLIKKPFSLDEFSSVIKKICPL
jgi:DNA-binding response OmpR family regulator